MLDGLERRLSAVRVRPSSSSSRSSLALEQLRERASARPAGRSALARSPSTRKVRRRDPCARLRKRSDSCDAASKVTCRAVRSPPRRREVRRAARAAPLRASASSAISGRCVFWERTRSIQRSASIRARNDSVSLTRVSLSRRRPRSTRPSLASAGPRPASQRRWPTAKSNQKTSGLSPSGGSGIDRFARRST